MSASLSLSVDGIDVLVEGRGRDVAVMIHGWPDTRALWDGLVARLAPRRRCARFTLPGFDPDGPARAPELDAMVAHVAAIVDAVSPEAPATLVVHDWGAFYGYQYAMRHPARIARIVGVDIGDVGSTAYRRSLGAKAAAGVAAYQLTLASAYAMPAPLGDAVSRRMAAWMRAPAPREAVRARMNYPYVQAWTGRFRGARPIEPRWPMLYLYGSRKPFMFHSPEWLERLAATPGCAAHGLRAGHWVMRDRAAEFESIVEDWLGDAPGG
jgi:pimeloyl-ACP methyl ester carboxylesterase